MWSTGLTVSSDSSESKGPPESRRGCGIPLTQGLLSSDSSGHGRRRTPPNPPAPPYPAALTGWGANFAQRSGGSQNRGLIGSSMAAAISVITVNRMKPLVSVP